MEQNTTIPLTRGMNAVIDRLDKDLASLKWCAARRKGRGLIARNYAVRTVSVDKKKTMILMHRVIMGRVLGRELEKYEQVDHKNHDGLDNRRANLRVATNQQNQQNQRISTRIKSSKFKGVSRTKGSKRWRAVIWIDGKPKHLGYFDFQEDAARAYDEVAKKIYGEYGYQNLTEKDGVE